MLKYIFFKFLLGYQSYITYFGAGVKIIFNNNNKNKQTNKQIQYLTYSLICFIQAYFYVDDSDVDVGVTSTEQDKQGDNEADGFAPPNGAPTTTAAYVRTHCVSIIFFPLS